MKRDCEACGAPMSSQAARCPRCGARQSTTPQLFEGRSEIDERLAARRRDPEKHAGTADDARDILRTTKFDDRTRNSVSGLLRAAWRPQTSGLARILERGLTVLAFPLVFVGILWSWWVHATRVANFMSAEIGPVSAALATGSLATYLYFFSDAPPWRWTIGTMTAAWIVRGALRVLAGPREV